MLARFIAAVFSEKVSKPLLIVICAADSHILPNSAQVRYILKDLHHFYLRKFDHKICSQAMYSQVHGGSYDEGLVSVVKKRD